MSLHLLARRPPLPMTGTTAANRKATIPKLKNAQVVGCARRASLATLRLGTHDEPNDKIQNRLIGVG